VKCIETQWALFGPNLEFASFMRFPRERQRILGDLSRLLFFNEDAAGHDSVICHAFGGKADIAPNRSHVLRYKNPHGLIGGLLFLTSNGWRGKYRESHWPARHNYRRLIVWRLRCE
jgi:hypothetical protein